MPKSKIKSKQYTKIIAVTLVMVMVTALVAALRFNRVKADQLQPLIDALSKQIQQNQSVVNQKQAEGDTLENKLAAIRADLDAAKANLEITRLKIRQVKIQLIDSEAELSKQTDLLGENIAVVYRRGGVSPIEILAGTDNLSQYVEKQEYYSSLRKKIDETIAKIKSTKQRLLELETQLSIRENEEKLISESIAKKESDLNNLLAKTRGEEQKYRELVESDRTKLNSLRAQQAAAIAAQSVGRDFSLNTEYPWQGVEPFPSWGVDPWGFYYRQCTSYAAWKRASLGKPIPSWGFLGPADAKDWPKWAKQFNIRVDTEPEVGAIGVYSAGEYGHVMIVEAIVNQGNQVLVSEFNAGWDGRYSQSLWPVNALTFIH